MKISFGGLLAMLKRQGNGHYFEFAACTEDFAFGWLCDGSGGLVQVWDATGS